jgi:hypothetical protein
MTDVTTPGDFQPGTIHMFADGYCAPSDFCNAILEQIREILPALEPGVRYTLEMLCDPALWRLLTSTEHQVAGRIMVRLVMGGWLPLRVVGCRHRNPKKYELA